MTQGSSVAEVLTRLTALSQELAGAFRPVTIVEIVARVLTERLAPARLSVMLLDVDSQGTVRRANRVFAELISCRSRRFPDGPG